MKSLIHLAETHPYRTITAVWILCLALYLAFLWIPRADGLLIGSDGIGYYMYVRSLVMDGDLNFGNEYQHLLPDSTPKAPDTPTGLYRNQFAIGPGLLWMPFFLIAHGITLALNALGIPIAADGYTLPYQALVCFGSMVYGYLGMLLIFRTVSKFYWRAALAACLLLWGATNFIYYLVIEPSMSHMVSLFATSLLVALWVEFRPIQTTRQWLCLGLAGGLVAVVRQPDALLLAMPLLDGWLQKIRRTPNLAGFFKDNLVFGIGFLATFSIQMTAWQILNGSPLHSGYIAGAQGFAWLHPKWLEVLFSPQHGLFLWHPLLLFAALGWIGVWQKDRRLAVLLALGFLSQVYVIGAWSSWGQGDAFGGRMFLASFPIFALGLSAALEWAADHRLTAAAWGIGLILSAWNALFLVQYRLGFISMGGPYTLQELTIGKWDMLASLARRVLGGQP